MEDIYKIREKAFEFVYSPLKEEGEHPTYSKYSSIYMAATSNVKDTVKHFGTKEKVLAVGGTGALGFEAALNGAKYVDLFDCNVFQRLFSDFMKTAIMYLDYPTFIRHFTLQDWKTKYYSTDLKELLAQELFDKLYPYLTQEVKFVFGSLYDYFVSTDLLLSRLFWSENNMFLDYLKKFISFYNEEDYYKLQRILRNNVCEINYKTASLIEVPNYYSEKYDLILLDNVLQYYKTLENLNTPNDVHSFIKNRLSRLLDKKGVIQVNYGFEIAATAFQQKFGLPYERNIINDNILSKFFTNKEIKEGINIPLYESGGYEYFFVPGVEEDELNQPKNLVLTYKKD